ncbi:MAG: YkgJ family cysteine cluster protein [Candidatus Omnitrophica bacterium]|nr:YkgJ family cysteine cluster protein [Candidatus Omnitrophota bacterium]
MSNLKKKHKKVKTRKSINCFECKTQADCCRFGAWIDLEEAKNILSLKLKAGYRVGTSYEDEPCSFLRADGLCSIHKIGYHLKPDTCKEFPYENNRISSFAHVLCTLYKTKIKKKNKMKRNGR